jgi:arabinofuranosyltransferase
MTEAAETLRPRWWHAALSVTAAAAPLLALAVAGGQRRWMSDDGFINLRVVQNALDGNGLVFNPGERVEAVTSPLWILVLTAAGVVRAPLAQTAAWLGVVLGVTGAALALVASLRLAGASGGVWRALRGRAWLPLGALVFAALPVVWDFLSSGLENGLTYLWIGASLAAVASLARVGDDAPDDALPLGRAVRAAALLGFGPMVRPDLAIATGLFGLVALTAVFRGRSRRDGLRAAVVTAAALGAVPVTWQLFRMGYYAITSPNTALAKEAFLSNWPQGGAYVLNYVSTYALLFPLGILVVSLAAGVASSLAKGWRLTALTRAAAATSGVLCALYVARVGGDFMHGRMLLPATFLLVAPLWLVPVGRGSVRVVSVGLVFAWACVCAAALRMTVENQHNIGDERGWYVRGSQVAHPVTVEDYRLFYFYTEGASLRAAADASCRSGHLPARGASLSDCTRVVYIDQPEYGALQGAIDRMPLDATTVHPGVVMVAARVAVGMMGMMLGPRVHLVDRVGLADPIASRLELATRGRPGHEKVLTNVWIAARYTAPTPGEDPAITEARRALHCGALAELDRALREPMSLRRFVANVRDARRFTALRIPGDPWEAARRFCPPVRGVAGVRGGEGGVPYSLDCPAGSVVSAITSTTATETIPTLGSVSVECRALGVGGLGAATGTQQAGIPATGPAGRTACPAGEVMVGLRGGYGALVDGVRPLCARLTREGSLTVWRGAHEGALIGGAGGLPWEVMCHEQTVLVGLSGRTAERVVATGPICAPTADFRLR